MMCRAFIHDKGVWMPLTGKDAFLVLKYDVAATNEHQTLKRRVYKCAD
jgi:hypothetical protein